MIRTALLTLALSTSAVVAAQQPCSVMLEAVFVEPDTTMWMPGATETPWFTEFDLRFTTEGEVRLVRPVCRSSAKVTVSFRDLHTGAVYTEVVGEGEECDIVIFPRIQNFVALWPREALELRIVTRAPPKGEYEVAVSYRNEPGLFENTCNRLRENPGLDDANSFVVACYTAESTPCEVQAPPFPLVLPAKGLEAP